MSAYEIQIPRNFTDIQTLLGWVADLEDVPDADEYQIDFRGPDFVRPFGMLVVGWALRSFYNSHVSSEITGINLGNDYASHMGFFNACYFQVGKTPGEARGSGTYLPITVVETSELLDEARSEYRDINEIIEQRVKRLVAVLCQKRSGPIFDALVYSLREVMRNVIEHSESPRLAYCAQYWPSESRAEIALLDEGVGIRHSLSQNPHLEIRDDQDALKLALMPGISGKMYKGIPRDPNNIWQNSGYGLYVVSRVCGRGGAFMICSGDSGLELTEDHRQYFRTSQIGTAIKMDLDVSHLRDFQGIISTIVNEGKRTAMRMMKEDYIEASTASAMLSTEFPIRKGSKYRSDR